MKTVLILIVLIATGVVYADNEHARRWRQNYEECAQMFGVDVDVRIDLILCAAIKSGEFLYTNGAYSPESSLRNLRILISDPVRLQQASEIFYKCDDEAIRSGAVGLWKTIKFLFCGQSIITFFDTE
ncbi:PREDICTED: uncharacterized protein LOC106749911 [Dinoponera quadriceps]|uniref:Uncharacterized protein LOC106749911 n=1 Tax=Dinoponera quadriceps TaxID=609295 RepID=A0A6P3Y4T2_DINQU|nr:PREDICTED: uncharacterized protein LOC106749911 [Dinoponera quadriceps]